MGCELATEAALFTGQENGTGETEPRLITKNSVISLLMIALLTNVVLAIIVACYFGSEVRLVEWLVMLSFPTALGIFLYCGWRISRDDAAFEKKPPRLRNLLSILTGEQPRPKGFRNRINFWSDLVGIGFGIYCMQVGSVVWYFQHRALERLGMTLFGFPIGNGADLLLGMSLAAYLAFVIFFAGIPRRRWWGMILLAGTIFICNTFMICFAKLWQHVVPQEFAMVFGMNAWYLLCFALAGVAGLWVFRKSEQNK